MFAKFTNLFSKEQAQAQNPLQQSFKHPKMDMADAGECPFMNKQAKKEAKAEPKSKNNPEKAKKQDKDSDSEQQKPKGGCPFMGTSQKKKNPSLGLAEYGYDEPFVSKFKYYLSANKLDFSGLTNKNKALPAGRLIFQKYPVYLQNTLFYNSEDYKKVRGLECCSRFMAYEQLREKGNKYYNKGKYYLALDYYERAMSLFRWLQYQENNNETVISELSSRKSLRNIDQSSENDSRINIEVNEQASEEANPFNELKDKYKEFFIVYNDDNTKYFDGEELTDTPDIDMRKSLLVQIYLNMAAAYINLHHYSLAEELINDGLTLSENVSQLYFRKAQSMAFNKASSLQKMKEAKELMEKAIEMRPKQKIFSTANANILKMLNLHDSQESYNICYEYIKENLLSKQRRGNELYERIYNRAAQINEIEKRMIKEGKIPKENLQEKALADTIQVKCLDRMIKKYHKVVQFYTQSKNEEQVTLAKKEFQQVLRIKSEVQEVLDVNVVEKDNELGGWQSQKITKRLNIIKSRMTEDIYNSGRYNFTMLEWALKEIVKEQAQQQKVKQSGCEQVKVESGKHSSNLYLLLLLIPLVIILFTSFIL